MMKKNRIVFTLVVIISIAYFSLGCGNDTKQNDTNSKQTSVTVEKSMFKQIGYFKTEQRDRAFCIYTTTKDTKEMIDHARKLQYTPGRQTVVHFFDSEKFTPDNSLQTKFEAGMWLDTPTFTDEYRQHMIGSYQKTITASEIWYDKDAATKEKMEGTAIK